MKTIILTAVMLMFTVPALAQIPHKENIKAIKHALEYVQERGTYVSDIKKHGVVDYGIDLRLADWQGDCEDWALAYKGQIEDAIGTQGNSLRVMYVKARRYDEYFAHAVLFIETTSGTYLIEAPYEGRYGKVYSTMVKVKHSHYKPEQIIGQLVYPKPTISYIIHM
ncbi:MAG: hypothetical protein COB09_17050 [Thalassobium sp.]|nr:MAG: hypothetical protein COB09_17050 [Thalassobium sp.]